MGNQALRTILESYSQRRCEILAEVEALDPEALTFKPASDQWAILEIIEHLVISERWILQNLPDTSALVAQTQTLRNRLMYPVVMFVLKHHITVPVPGQDGLPKGNVSLPVLRVQWEESQQWLRRHTDGVIASGRDQAVFAHPVAGPLTTMQAVRMGRLHLEYHARQIRNRLNRRNGLVVSGKRDFAG